MGKGVRPIDHRPLRSRWTTLPGAPNVSVRRLLEGYALLETNDAGVVEAIRSPIDDGIWFLPARGSTAVKLTGTGCTCRRTPCVHVDLAIVLRRHWTDRPANTKFVADDYTCQIIWQTSPAAHAPKDEDRRIAIIDLTTTFNVVTVFIDSINSHFWSATLDFAEDAAGVCSCHEQHCLHREIWEGARRSGLVFPRPRYARDLEKALAQAAHSTETLVAKHFDRQTVVLLAKTKGCLTPRLWGGLLVPAEEGAYLFTLAIPNAWRWNRRTAYRNVRHRVFADDEKARHYFDQIVVRLIEKNGYAPLRL